MKKLITKAEPKTKKNPVLRMGDLGADVKTLQKLLVKHGSTVKVTGKFDIGTRSAVYAFQKKCINSGKFRSILATGVVDSATWKALNK